jgi:hypothetical protein
MPAKWRKMPIASACPGVGLGLKYLLLGAGQVHVKVEFTTVDSGERVQDVGC